MRYIYYPEYLSYVDKLHQQLQDRLNDQLKNPNFRCGILGVARGGLPVAVHLSHSLELPMATIHVTSYDDDNNRDKVKLIGNDPYHRVEEIPDHIILVDDIVDSGGTMLFMRNYLVNLRNSIQPPRKIDVTTCVVIFKPTAQAESKPDLYGTIVESEDWIAFPYEKESCLLRIEEAKKSK